MSAIAQRSRRSRQRRQSSGMLASRLRTRALVCALGATVGVTACGADFHLSVSSFDIGPSPAVPGDMVVALFVLRLVPTQRHTMIVWIDNTEHLRVTSDEAPPTPVVLDLGDAADLIETYGTGAHSAYVQVQAHDANETTRTQSASFELAESTPYQE